MGRNAKTSHRFDRHPREAVARRPRHRAGDTTRGASMLVLAAALGLGSTGSRPAGVPSTLSFDRLGLESGLSNSHVNTMLQDHEGYLWVGTADGLNRYDGYSVTVFRHDPADPTTVRGNWISILFRDIDDNLCVVFGIGGIDRFDRARETFEHVSAPHDSSSGEPPDTPAVGTIAQDATGDVWVGSPNGLSRLERRYGGWQAVPHELPHTPDEPATHHVTRLLRGENGNLWIGTARHGVMSLDVSSGIVTRLPAMANGSRVPPGIGDLLEDRAGRLWIATSVGLFAHDRAAHVYRRWLAETDAFAGRPIARVAEDAQGAIWFLAHGRAVGRLDPATGQVDAISLPRRAAGGGGPPFQRLFIDSEGRTWLATGVGIELWDPAAGTFREYLHDPTDPRSLPHDHVSALLEDRSGSLWVGTWGGGAAKLDERSLRFHPTRNPLADPSLPSTSSIHALLVDGDDRLWLGTPSGLFVVGDGRGEEGPGARGLRTAHGTASVYSLHEDRKGRIWIGHQHGVTIRTISRDGRRVDEREIPEAAGQPVYAIHEAPGGTTWLGSRAGLLRVAPDGSVRKYPVRRNDTGALPAGRVSALLTDSRGALWVGTFVGGLSRLDVATDTFRHYLPAPAPSDRTINSKSVTDLLEDRAGRIWIGTYSGGVNVFDPSTDRFRHLTVHDGLAGMRVAGILEDGNGRIWISTNGGLSRFDPASETFKSYDVNDGLQGDEFNLRARTAAGGLLLFGGVNGFNAFDPDEIVDNRTKPGIAITACRVMDRPTRLASLRGRRHDIELPHDRNFIAFEFAALDFTNPRKNTYAYKLEGLDAGWIDAGTRRYAAYTGLDPGEYVFRVKGANNDGVWNEAGVSLSLRVVPPFWQTAWFSTLVALTFTAAGLLAHRAIARRRVAQSLALERVRVAERERVREEVSRDYHDEMGARLTKISIFTELIRRRMNGHGGSAARPSHAGDDREAATGNEPSGWSEEVTGYVERVAHSAEILSRESRDFIWALNPTKDTLLDVAHYLQEFAADLFADTPVTFEVRGLTGDLSTARVDMRWKRQVTLIFKEGLTNCLKHAGDAHVVLAFAMEDRVATITLTDDGTGIEGGGTAASAGDTGTAGLGLESMQGRARELGGALTITTHEGRGTTVALVAPLPEPVS